MENEIIILKNKQAVTTSLKVAEVFNKRHDNVLKTIENLKDKIKFNLLKNEVVKMFLQDEYIDEKGETRRMYYMNRSKLANNMAGIKERDNVTVMQLNTLGIYENICLYEIEDGMKNDLNYKQIYQKCKTHCEEAKSIALLQAV